MRHLFKKIHMKIVLSVLVDQSQSIAHGMQRVRAVALPPTSGTQLRHHPVGGNERGERVAARLSEVRVADEGDALGG